MGEVILCEVSQMDIEVIFPTRNEFTLNFNFILKTAVFAPKTESGEQQSANTKDD